jgi:hypothetical protein
MPCFSVESRNARRKGACQFGFLPTSTPARNFHAAKSLENKGFLIQNPIKKMSE